MNDKPPTLRELVTSAIAVIGAMIAETNNDGLRSLLLKVLRILEDIANEMDKRALATEGAALNALTERIASAGADLGDVHERAEAMAGALGKAAKAVEALGKLASQLDKKK